jgi:hypothetical protein
LGIELNFTGEKSEKMKFHGDFMDFNHFYADSTNKYGNTMGICVVKIWACLKRCPPVPTLM